MASAALGTFDRLHDEATKLKDTARREHAAGYPKHAASCLRSAIVLAVAAVDTYFHEQGVRLLLSHLNGPLSTAGAVQAFTGLANTQLTGPSATGLVRWKLSYKTFQSPVKIDDLFRACGLDAEDIWLRSTVAYGSRPDRVRLSVQLQTDRRNQIAHEGDWDPVALQLRAITETHVDDCVGCLGPLVRHMDTILP